MKKIAFSGTHGTGKTTASFRLVTELKMENYGIHIGVLQEIARLCPLPINEQSTPESQLWMFTRQIEEEIWMSTDIEILVCDRTVLDVVAYSKYFMFDIWKSMYELSKYFMKSYDLIYIKTIKNNDFNYKDGVRSNSDKFRNGVEEILLGLYNDLEWEGIINSNILKYE